LNPVVTHSAVNNSEASASVRRLLRSLCGVQRYRILPHSSRVWIDASSNVHPIHTEAKGLEGWLEFEFDVDDEVNVDLPPRGHLEYPVENLKSGNALQDRELRRRIDSRRYPTIAGDLTGMKRCDDPSRYLVTGELTFRGVKRTYEDEMTIEMPNDHTMTLTGQATFDIRDFGMEPPRILMLKVQPEVTVRVEIVADLEH
jgi:polyisoprenoid-binding protein YceI